MTLLGIDLGTTSVKAAVFDDDGTRLAAARRGHVTHRPAPGYAEQHPDDWWAGLTGAVAELAGAGVLGDVTAVGLCGQVNTHLVTDAAGSPLHPAVTWQDSRCAETAAALTDRLPDGDRARVRGGLGTVDASHPAARAAWFAAHRPEVWARTERLLAPKDQLLLRLTGTVAADPISSIGLVGPDGRYPDRLDLLVPGLRDLLPPLADPATVVGETTGAGGLPAGLPVATGTMDAWAALLGGGVCVPGDAIDVAGTSEVLATATGPDAGGRGVVAFPPWQGLHVLAGPTQAGGDALAWAGSVLGADVAGVLDLAAAAEPGCDGLLFLPQLAGERAPVWDASLRAHWLGATFGTGRAELARAAAEGVAHAARHVLTALETAAGRPVAHLTACGGGSRSDLWCRIKADVLDRPLHRTAEPDAGVLGAAMLAGLATGAASSVGELAARMVRVDRVFTPDPRTRARYDDAHGRYLEAQRLLGPLFAG
ncbi:xylulokinase [Pseudonocardia phyllosphaerae]|uniref:xylulokinase n=1 Tax=Pseudonocardia phyllosphaerae TaxID=3390502 RepID=UPI0039787AA1